MSERPSFASQWEAGDLDEPDEVEPRAFLDGMELQGQNLVGIDLSDMALNHARFLECNCSTSSFSGSNLYEAFFYNCDLTDTNMEGARLSQAVLSGSTLARSKLQRADLYYAELQGIEGPMLDIRGADLEGTNFHGALLADALCESARWSDATLRQVDLRRANLHEATLAGADMRGANLDSAVLSCANLRGCDLTGSTLSNSILTGAQLSMSRLVETDVDCADLTGAYVYGASVWNIKGSPRSQNELIITPPDSPPVTVDNLDVAQFIYLLLSNAKIRDVIDTVTAKVVLILGRFTPERKVVLDAIRASLRQRGFTPVIFDFDPSDSRDLTETVTLLARMARFIIADLTDPSSIPLELQAIVPDVAVPVVPILSSFSVGPFAMFRDLARKYHWVLPIHRYADLNDLLATLPSKVIDVAVTKSDALRIPPK
jgi:uncharacterized protein YjbI with pentapeptide repeats